MGLKGKVRVPDPVYEEVLAVIATMGEQEEFGVRDICARIPHRTATQIIFVLINKSRSGALERIRRGLYRKGGTNIRTKIPMGMVSEAVWAVLFTGDRWPMRLGEIVGEVEAYIGRSSYHAHRSVASALCRWYVQGYLERSGPRGEYAYQLRSGVTERPAMHR